VPFEILPANGDDVTEVRMWGSVTADDITEFSDRLLEVAHEWCRILYDGSEVDDAAAALTLYLRSRWRREMPMHVRQALVVGPGGAAVARTWARAAREGSAGVQAFPSRAAALEWLRSDFQATTGAS
jgi:hypothetical protein